MGNIKGITIEIDGKTTGLTKALEEVNRNVKSVSSELREVNQLLKLDPGNTELIAQKQKLLTQAIEETTQKLSTLKKAKSEADQQFKDGKISEEQYRALDRELIKTEQSLSKLNSELGETEKKSKNIDFDKLTSNLSSISKVAGKVALEIGKVAAAMVAALGAAVAYIGKKMIDSAINAGAFADELLTLSAKTNVSAETLQNWSYASEFIDTSVESMTSAMAKMTRGLETNDATFKSLGVTVKDNSGHFRSQEDIFMDTIDALGQVENATERDAIAMKLFGKSAQELNPLIKVGGSELRRLGDEAIAAGLVLSGETLSRVASFDDTVQKLKMQFGALGKNITAAFLPAIASLAEPLKTAMGDINVILSDGIQGGDVEKISQIVSGLIENIGSQLAAGLPKLIEFIVPAISGLIGVVVNILPTLIPILLTGVLSLIMGIVGAIQSNLQPLMEMAVKIVESLSTFLINNLPTILAVGVELLFALINGIVEAIPTLIPALIAVVLSIIELLLNNIDKVIETGVAILIALIDGIVASLPILIAKLPTIIESVVTTLITLSPKLAIAALQIVVALAGGLIKALPQIWAATPKIWKAVFDGIMAGVSNMQSIGKNMVEGLWSGLNNSIGWIKSKITAWVGDVMKFLKKLFGIASPSKVMKKEIGLNLGFGVAEGIEGSIGMVRKAMGNLSREVEASVNPIINPTANSNPLILQIENFINERKTDVEAFMEEAEFYRRNALLAGGVK